MATKDKEATKDFTPVELAFIKAVLRNSKTRLNADWDKVAEGASSQALVRRARWFADEGRGWFSREGSEEEGFQGKED